MTCSTVKRLGLVPLACALVLCVLAQPALANCHDLKGRNIRLSNGALLTHAGGDLFKASGLESDTYALNWQQRRYVLMRINYDHFQCLD